jgi:hypothetical protein
MRYSYNAPLMTLVRTLNLGLWAAQHEHKLQHFAPRKYSFHVWSLRTCSRKLFRNSISSVGVSSEDRHPPGQTPLPRTRTIVSTPRVKGLRNKKKDKVDLLVCPQFWSWQLLRPCSAMATEVSWPIGRKYLQGLRWCTLASLTCPLRFARYRITDSPPKSDIANFECL